MTTTPPRKKLFDIGVNLTDGMFRGLYRGKQKHPNDFHAVIRRAHDAGVVKFLSTGTSLAESKDGIDLARSVSDIDVRCTVGCHPTQSLEFENTKNGNTPAAYLDGLRELIEGNRDIVAAVGESGLDYDRLKFCPKDVQMKYFLKQIDLAEEVQLPMFLHMRNADEDFLGVMGEHRDRIVGGVVHSFTGPLESARALIDMGFFIGINGCSLKTEENLAVVKEIPLEKMMIETDAPWCEVRPTHAGYPFVTTKVQAKKKEKWEEGLYVKGRNEPALLTNVVEVLSKVMELDEAEIASVTFENAERMFS